MSEDSTGGTSYGVPIAIIIAGALVALAVYFGGSAPAVAPTKSPTADAGEVNNGAPQVPSVGDMRPVSKDDHVKGATNPKIVVVEYSDTECPFCKQFHSTLQQLIQEYPNDVQWVYRYFPLEQLHQQAFKEAVAVECAAEQGKFWEFLDLVYKTTPSNDGLDLGTLPALAKQAGVANASQFESCRNSGKYDDKIKADIEDAKVAGGRGTPYSVIIGPDGTKEPLSGALPYSSVKAAVDKYLK